MSERPLPVVKLQSRRETTLKILKPSAVNILPDPKIVITNFEDPRLADTEMHIVAQGIIGTVGELRTSKREVCFREVQLLDPTGTCLSVMVHGEDAENPQLRRGVVATFFSLISQSGLDGEDGYYWSYTDGYILFSLERPVPPLKEVVRIC